MGRESPLTCLLEVVQGILTSGEVLDGEQDHRVADLDLVSVGKDGLVLNPLAIDERAVPAGHVQGDEGPMLLVVADLEVLAGGAFVQDLDGHGLVAAHHGGPLPQGVVLHLLPAYDEQ